jgi:methylenetetrahydrofolate reductase (NADPH)
MSMLKQSPVPADAPPQDDERETIVRWMRNASVEMTVHDVPYLPACRSLLGESASVYVSYLPKQTWPEMQRALTAVRAAGFEPIPHVPARQLESRTQLEAVLRGFADDAAVSRILLIAGDRPNPRGPFRSTVDVLRTGLLAAHGIQDVVIAGHPEGHPTIAEPELRASEHARIDAAQAAGLNVTFLTQFCFTAAPIIDWVRQLRANGIQAPVVAGLAGPARLKTLLKYATICGVGPSLRTLTTRAGILGQLTGERGPETVIRALAHAAFEGTADLAGVHLFSFGGLAHTCEWINAAARREIRLTNGGFEAVPPSAAS